MAHEQSGHNAHLGWTELGARFRAAREAIGMRQEDAAGLLAISRPTLSAIEAGKTRVDSLLLRRFATLYRRDVSSFFEEAGLPPSDDLLRTVAARLGPVRPHDQGVIATFLAFCDNLSFVRDLLGRPRSEPPPPRPFSSDARKYAAETEAKEERARLGLGDALIGERLFELLEMFGLPAYRARLEDERISGLLVQHPEAGPVIFVNAAQYRWRQVFTAAHEYGHFLFHRSAQPVACRIFAAEGEESAVTSEEFVNAFASELLMPEDGIKRLLVAMGATARPLGPEEVVRLQRHFGVSFRAMLYRLLRLRLLKESDVHRMREEVRPVALAWRLGYAIGEDEFGEPEQDELALDRKFPTTYVEMVLEAFERDMISNGRAAELLELNRGAFDRFCRLRRRAQEVRQSEEGLERVVV